MEKLTRYYIRTEPHTADPEAVEDEYGEWTKSEDVEQLERRVQELEEANAKLSDIMAEAYRVLCLHCLPLPGDPQQTFFRADNASTPYPPEED